ncbi:MAG TPA: hypothetical protein VGW10_01410, partial [Solirubrobacteraceae bacterium]|nr:hypothetical protein [Solirubrobacteraceae bacterium]
REQLERWGAQTPEEEPPPERSAEPRAPHDAPSPDDPAAAAPAPHDAPSPDDSAAAPLAPHDAPSPDDVGPFPELDAPLPPKSPPAEPSPPSSRTERAADAQEDETRRRLQAIAAELRAAVPSGSAVGGGADVIGDLQRAAERLRAAAEQELERLERGGEPEAGTVASEEPSGGVAATTPALAPKRGEAIHQLGARRTSAREGPWLRVGLERLATGDPETAARLLAALLPMQALVADDIAYDLTAPTAGTLRVVLTGGTALVEPRQGPGDRDEVDVLVEGPLDALAPLAAGGAGWRLKGAQVRGSRRRLRRLLKARRDPIGLVELGRAGSPVHPGLLLSALVAAIDPARARGYRFAVTYEIGGDGTFTVVAGHGDSLRVVPENAPPEFADCSAKVVVSAPAFMPLIAGEEPPEGEEAVAIGDRRFVDLLHAWFDKARG